MLHKSEKHIFLISINMVKPIFLIQDMPNALYKRMYIDFFFKLFLTFFLRRAPKSFNVETKFPFLFFSFIVLYPPRYLPLIIYHNLLLSAQSLFQYIYSNWHIYNETDSSRKFIMVNRVKKHAQSNFNPIGHVYCSKNLFTYLFYILFVHFCIFVCLFDFSLCV